MENENLYRENILEHYRNPENKKEIFLNSNNYNRADNLNQVNKMNKDLENLKIISETGDNPDCGDSGNLFLKIQQTEKSEKENEDKLNKKKNEIVKVDLQENNFGKTNVKKDFLILEASFLGEGCAISQAAFDMLAGELKGKLISEIRTWTPAKIYELLQIKITPARVNCALLGYRALEKILKKL